MIFNSLLFLGFLIVTFAVYWSIPHKYRSLIIVVASYVFYGWWDYRFLSLIVFSTLLDYAVGKKIDASNKDTQRKQLLAVSIVFNLGILAVFKYVGFFVDSFSRMVEKVGLDISSPVLKIALPVGISFYTFQTLSYTFDVYRKRIAAEKSLVNFAAYVAYFPQLVAGPIERAQNLLPQITQPSQFPKFKQFQTAIALIVTGLFKKVVLADGIAPMVNERFAQPEQYSSLSLIIGAYAFAIQIYGDFSGYSSIARGTSRLFGIELMRNFEQPYFSVSITQFWRTWHMSLSNWLHDYLYIPLGGNRSGKFNTYRNLMLTMILGGLWHGAALSFVIWGLLHGLFLAVHRVLGAYEPRGKPGKPRVRDVWKIGLTFTLVSIAWIFFRADSNQIALSYLGRISSFEGAAVESRTLLWFGTFLIMMIVIDFFDRNRDKFNPIERLHPLAHGAICGIVFMAIIAFSGGEPVEFIYFQF